MSPKGRGGFVHPQPTHLPVIDGPFATASSRAGGTTHNRTTLHELATLSLERCYIRGSLVAGEKGHELFPFRGELNGKVVLWRGDITTLQVSALVNAANRKLLGGGGVDGAIHRAAGQALTDACEALPVKERRGTYDVRIECGEVALTDGFGLPASKVIHTAGPDMRRPLRDGNLEATQEVMQQQLRSCYTSSLELAVKEGIKTVAFPAISVGV